MARQCPFLQLNKGWFGPTYHCEKTKEDVLTGSALYDNYCNNYESSYTQCPHFGPKKSGSDCYITSACSEAKGLPDDCDELMTLRDFRDNWLAKELNGKEVIEEYYRIAPRIVEAIHADPLGREILQSLYDEMIVPCVRYIKSGENNNAYELYRRMTINLKEKYCIE